VVILIALTLALGGPRHSVTPILFAFALGVVTWRALAKWRSLLAAMILVILFVPIRKYSLPAALPINLEPYRLIVALVAGAWLASSMIDQRVRFRRSGVIDKPLVAFCLVVVLSLLANMGRVSSVGPDAIKAVLFFVSYIVVVYLVSSLVETQEDLDYQIKVLVYGGAVVAFFCLIERRTHYNVFDHLSQIMPFLRETTGPLLGHDSRGARVFGSSQHPIAMGVALVMLVPLAIYRAIAHGGRLAWVAAVVMLMGAAGTISRTAVVAFAVVCIAMVIMKPKQMKRLWPALIPAVLLVHFAMPGALGTIKAAFFPSTGLIAQQTNDQVGSGRLATLGPALKTEFKPNPIVGEGFGTRVTTPDPTMPVPNGPILDDEWLGILLETGVLGALAFAWIIVRFIRRVGGAAKRDSTERGWFLAAVTAGIAAYGVSMFLYDAMSFIQVTFIFFILIGLGSAGYRLGAEEESRTERDEPSRLPSLVSASRIGN
jgi:hypothetical protein